MKLNCCWIYSKFFRHPLINHSCRISPRIRLSQLSELGGISNLVAYYQILRL
jgi:hypothetical protein